MPKKLRAVETIPGKLWITYDTTGGKSGTLTKQSDNDWLWLRTGKQPLSLNESDANDMFDLEEKAELSSWHQEHVLGYPVIKIETFKTQEKENLPCFTKTPQSKVFFAAGYYGINFDNGGWMESFCPKLATLRKYEYMGPFKTETDMQIAIQRKKRSYE